MKPTVDEIEIFLASVEKRGYMMAEIATGSNVDALDILQDAMLAFLERYTERPENQWPPLFYRVLQNKIRDWYRWNKVRNKYREWFGTNHQSDLDTNNLHCIENMPDIRPSNPLTDLQDSHFSVALVTSLQQLPLRQQQAFLLRTWEGLSVAETANAMSCSEGSVKTHLARANKALRERLEKYR